MSNMNKMQDRALIRRLRKDKLIKRRGWEKTLGKPLISVNKLT